MKGKHSDRCTAAPCAGFARRVQPSRYNIRMPATKKARVLFVCIGNACRSPMAEAVARREAGDVIEPVSAGLYPLGRIAEPTVEALVANGYSVEGLSSKSISRESVREADLIVNLTGAPIDNLFLSARSDLRHGQQLENWGVSDPYGEDSATYQRILEEIALRVRQLAGRLRAAEGRSA
jgi:arsenate reductase (thioredoxin)